MRLLSQPGTGAPAGRRQLAAASLLSAAVTGLWALAIPLARVDCCDALMYLTMSRDPAAAVPTPYSYRILLPRVVHWLGTDPEATYHLIALACLVASGPLTYLLARRLGAGHRLALLGMVALLSSRGWTFYLHDPWLSDPPAFLLLAAAFLALVSGGRWVLAPLLAVLASTRELFVGMALPLYTWWRRRPVDPPAALRAALVLLPGVAVYLLIAASVPASGMSGSERVAHLLSTRAVVEVVEQYGWQVVPNTFAMSLGVWWVLALPALRDGRVRRLAAWLLPVLAQLLLGGDWSRFGLYAFPVLIPAGCLVLARAGAARRRLLLALVGAQLPVPLVDVLAGRPTLNYPGPSLAVTLVLMALTAAALAAPLPTTGRRQPEPVPDGLAATAPGPVRAAP